jgi:hypothetical protein
MLFLLGIQVVNMLGETIVSPLGPSSGIAPEFPGSQPGVLSIGRRPTHVLSCCLKRSNKKLGLALRPDPKEKSLCQTDYSSVFQLKSDRFTLRLESEILESLTRLLAK